MTPDKHSRTQGQRGNVLFFLFLMIGLLAVLTVVATSRNAQVFGIKDDVIRDEQIARLLAYSATLSGAVQQMVASNSMSPQGMYWSLSVIAPGAAGWDTAPHGFKLFHPYGGGVTHMSATGSTSSSETVATNFRISTGSIINGVGDTNAVIGDIVFTATIANSASCQAINKKVWGSTTMPTMSDAAYTAMITNGTNTTVAAGNCANCVNKAAACVVNVSGNAYGYYQVLLPG